MGWTDAGRRKAAAHRKGRHLSNATKKKISRALKGKKHPHKGHKESAATRAKISKKLKGKKHPHKGHPMSAATRAKISAALKGRHRKHKASTGHKLRPGTGNHSGRITGHKQGKSNARIVHVHVTRIKIPNWKVLSLKERHDIRRYRTGTNRRVILSREHRRRRRA